MHEGIGLGLSKVIVGRGPQYPSGQLNARTTVYQRLRRSRFLSRLPFRIQSDTATVSFGGAKLQVLLVTKSSSYNINSTDDPS